MGLEAPMLLSSSFAESNAMKSQGAYAQQTGDLNAKIDEMNAQDAERRGADQANQARIKARQTIGEQRATLAAQGVDVGSGTALDLQRETASIGEQEAQMIKNNTWREAWGYKMQALNDRTAGKFANSGANFRANMTVLTGGMRAMSSAASEGYKFAGAMGGGGGMSTGTPRPSVGGSYRDYSNYA